MKYLYLRGIALLFTAFSLTVSAQSDRLNEPNQNKPRLFDAFSNDININAVQLSNLLDYEVGQSVNITLAPGFQFLGQVVSTSNKSDNNIQSIVVSSSNFNGARLTFTKVTDENMKVSYTGRIISFQNGDVFELVNRDNQYYFIKKKFYDLVNE